MIKTSIDYNIFSDLVELSADQRQLFELILKSQGEDLAQIKIPKRDLSNIVPLSHSQERVWNVSQLTPDSAVDNVPVALHIIGDFNLEIFKKSVSLLMQRNEILRTVCTIRDRQPTQTVLQDIASQVEVVDLRDLPEDERLEAAVSKAKEVSQLPFNLTRDILLRALVFSLKENEHVILLVAHQFVTDGLSFRILLQELSTIYNAVSNDRLTALPESTIQYADFSIWQHQWFANSVLEPQVLYWKNQLASSAHQLRLPIYQNCQFPTYKGAYRDIEFSAEQSNLFRTICREQGVTVFMAFAALFQIILYHYTNEEDICIGTLTSNRNRRETETLIGNFSNNLLLRSRLSSNLSFFDLLAQVRETSLEANKHQDVPFQSLLNSVKDLPRFQVLLILRNSTTAQSCSMSGLNVSDIPIDIGLTRMDLSLDLTDDGQNPIFGKLEYKTELFQAETIGKIIQNFEALLESITDRPNQTLADIKLPVTIERPHLQDSNQQGSNDIQVSNTNVDSIQEKSVRQLTEPRSNVEKEIAVVWAEVFDIQQIGIHDNFFELGGHSLMAIRIAEKLQNIFQIEFPLHNLFRAPTVAGLADCVESILAGDLTVKGFSIDTSIAEEEKIASLAIAIKPNGARPPFFWINNLQQTQALAKFWGSERGLYCLDIFGLADDYILTSTQVDLMYIASQFVKSMQKIQPKGPYLLGSHCINTQLAFEVSQQLMKLGEKVAFLGLFDPLDWETIKFKKMRHWKNFRNFGFDYLLFKLGLYLRGRKESANSKFYSFIYPSVQKFLIRHQLFEEELSEEINIYLSQYYKAVNNYIPARYPGKIDVFLTGEYASLVTDSLESLAQEGIEKHVLKPYHVLLFVEKSHIDDLGNKLRACLVDSEKRFAGQ